MNTELANYIVNISGVVILLLIAACVWFLKQVADDIKETRKTVAGHAIKLARHDVMYQLWLDELSTPAEHPERRASDRIRRLIAEIASEETDV